MKGEINEINGVKSLIDIHVILYSLPDSQKADDSRHLALAQDRSIAVPSVGSVYKLLELSDR